MLTLAVYSLDLPAYACARLRLLGPAGALKGKVDLRWAARSDGSNYAISAQAMQGADGVVFQRYFPMQDTWPLVEQALASGLPVLYDTDDNFLAVPHDHPMRLRLEPVIPFAAELLARADCVTVSTPELKRAFAGRARRVEVLPNLIDERLWSPAAVSVAMSDSGPVRIVFAGTPSRSDDLAFLVPVLAGIQGRYGQGVAFTFLGCTLPGVAAQAVPFQEDYAGYARVLAALQPDIGLAPLADSPFNRCKSPVKWLEYSAVGAAGVYADLPPYARVTHGVTGLKVGPDPEQWFEALDVLIRDGALRRRLASQARAEVLSRWSLRAGAEGYQRLWQSIIAGGHRPGAGQGAGDGRGSEGRHDIGGGRGHGREGGRG